MGTESRGDSPSLIQNIAFWSMFLLAIVGVVLSGCATMEGMGQDIEEGGEEIQEEAEEASN